MFTSCASEANNYALKAFALANQQRGRHIITSCAEHSSIMSSAAQLEKVFGFEVTYLPLHADGTVHLEDVRSALRKDTILVSIMCVNNETGCINDIRAIADHVHAHSRAMMHSDLVQALGKMDIDLSFLDMATFSAHKIFASRAAACCFIGPNVELLPLISAGQQEDGLRGGTSNAPQRDRICQNAAGLALEEQQAHIDHVRQINAYARRQLQQIRADRYQFARGGTAVHSEFFLPVCGQRDHAQRAGCQRHPVSARRAHAIPKAKAISHVLLAMGKDEVHATHAVRLSFSASDHDGRDRFLHSVIKGDYKRLCDKDNLVYDHILIRYGELSTKGKNRKDFIKKLFTNVKNALSGFPALTLEKTHDRMYINLNGEDPFAVKPYLEKVFGISSFSFAIRCASDIEAIKATTLTLARKEEGRTFNGGGTQELEAVSDDL